ncbi:MAG: hypothetical protein ACO2ZZ_11105 [Cyclobacteriaceae bacterium]
MKKLKNTLPAIAALLISIAPFEVDGQTINKEILSGNDYEDLTQLFQEWRTFEKPPMLEGAPDYTKATFEQRYADFQVLQKQLLNLDTSNWTTAERVDWMIVWSEMNGYDFNHRILKPWERDPAFYKTVWTYKSDVPAHEGPTHHATLELWTYDFPLDKKAATKMIDELNVIPPLNAQAKKNLTGNARDLWIAGIRDIREQSKALNLILLGEEVSRNRKVVAAVKEAIASTDALALWLERESINKDGPSGIGKENYSWYMQNVHLVPLSWEDEVMILKRELARAWSSLKMEEHRNRRLTEISPADSPEAYDALADRAATSLINFLREEDIVTVKDYFEPALRERLGTFVPEETRNFFWITAHLDPRPLYSHFYHWFELARMENEPNPSPIRRHALLYNIFDSRNEGTATAVEELFMQNGLYEDSPRSREIVYILICQRAARGLGSLYAHANMMTMEEAGGIHSTYTPRGWMKTEKELLLFEQHLYLRQPGYGTSYITGKHLLDATIMDYALRQEREGSVFLMKNFLDELNSIGNIPVSLGRWQMTGKSDHLIMMK